MDYRYLLDHYLQQEGHVSVADSEAAYADARVDCLRRYSFSSVVPGVCTDCHEISDRMEPDQDAGWCWGCDGRTVVSVVVLCLGCV